MLKFIFIVFYFKNSYIFVPAITLKQKTNIMTTLNAYSTNHALELLKELGSVEFEQRFEIDKSNQDIIKFVGMDKDFEILGYAILDLN